MGVSAITYQEMRAYFSLKSIEPEPIDIDLIAMFDSIAIDIARKQQEAESKNNKKASK